MCYIQLLTHGLQPVGSLASACDDNIGSIDGLKGRTALTDNLGGGGNLNSDTVPVLYNEILAGGAEADFYPGIQKILLDLPVQNLSGLGSQMADGAVNQL